MAVPVDGPIREARTLLLTLHPVAGPPAGTVAPLEDGGEPLPFHGWVELMAAIDVLRSRPVAVTDTAS